MWPTPPTSWSPGRRSSRATPRWPGSSAWPDEAARSHRAENRHHFPVDEDVVGVVDELVHRLVGGLEHDLAPAPGERLHGRLLAGDTGDDGLAGLGRALLADDDVVAVEDARLDHRVAPDPEHEQLPPAGEVLGERQDLLDVPGREHTGAGGDVADERDVADGPAVDRGTRTRLEADFDGPRL